MKRLTLPLTNEVAKDLKNGEIVSLFGKLLTARDAAHKRLCDEIAKGKCSVNLKDQTIFYVGACEKDGKTTSAGPTTSSRMDKYTPLLLENGLRGMIGKGERSKKVMQAIKDSNAVYFLAIGGAGAFYAQKIKSKKLIAYPDLLAEAVYEIEVEDFKVVVSIIEN